jgi:hypothetical protein
LRRIGFDVKFGAGAVQLVRFLLNSEYFLGTFPNFFHIRP